MKDDPSKEEKKTWKQIKEDTIRSEKLRSTPKLDLEAKDEHRHMKKRVHQEKNKILWFMDPVKKNKHRLESLIRYHE